MFQRAKQNLNDNEDWTLAQTMFGITTWYRREPEDNSLSIKMEGVMDGVPLFEQVAVLREVDLHCKWAPFCTSSMTVAHVDKLDTVGWFVVGLPNFGLMRDGCFRAIGCDSIAEDGSILLVGKGVEDIPKGKEESKIALDEAILSDDPVLKTLDIPKPPTRVGAGRITIRTFHAIIEVQSATVAKTKLVANIDPNLPLFPQSLLEFIMKKLCGVLLAKLQGAAKKILKDPVANPHARKMREEEQFYKGWLIPKFKGAAEQKKWEMPPVAAFNLTDEQMEQAAKAELKTGKKFFHSASGDNLDRILTQKDSNVSNKSEPAYVGQKFQEADSISEISGSSMSSTSSIWKNNPIAQYLRELEEKTQLKKAKKISKSRERAAKRLKPKELDVMAQSRLKELRAARNRRRINHASDSGTPLSLENATKSQRVLIKDNTNKKDWATFWTGHGFVTRTVVVSVLLFLLFGILYSDSLSDKMSPLAELFSDKPFIYQLILQNMGTIGLMLFAAGIHFSLCYVLLMYSFSELQIGKLAGRQAKRFYSKNLHLILLGVSGSMVALALSKTIFMIAFRSLAWHSMRATRSTVGLLHPMANGLALATPDTIETLITGFWSLTAKTYSLIVGAIVYVISFFQGWLLDSNAIGKILKSLIVGIISGVEGYQNSWSEFLQHVSDQYEGQIEHVSWRKESFEATRYLLTHSAVFLMVILLLFNLQAKRARGEDGEHEEDASTTNETSSVGSTKISEERSFSRVRFPSADYAFDTIEEETDSHMEKKVDFKRRQTS